MSNYDAIVLGTGGVGSAAAYHLARRGMKTLAVEQFTPGHARGSSHGQTRIIRMAYFEHPDYVPLLRRAYALWEELERTAGRSLFKRVGLLQIGPPDGSVVPGVLAAAAQHGLPVEEFSHAALAREFPQFQAPGATVGVLERNAGYLLVEDCVLAHTAAARGAGAAVRSDEAVVGWEASADGCRVQTTHGEHHAARLVIAAGAWSPRLLADVPLGLAVVRKHLHWYAATDERYRGGPTFFYEMPEGTSFYGFPPTDALGVKVAEHSGGEAVDDPTHVDRLVDTADRGRVEQFIEAHLPGVSLTPTRHEVCMYTRSPDGHFIVDVHPQHSAVCFAAGLSGHGFKFTSVLGEILADLAIDGATQLPAEFLTRRR
ncbi:MAG: N-methyl-L-tryptophan oxidase [Planctomycetales bacterium]|nr:N-methyl-L-tryptophan oxidase [Planctomycetales bacterium]